MKDSGFLVDPNQRKMEYIASSLVLRAIAIKHMKNVNTSTGRTPSTTQIPSRNPELGLILHWFREIIDGDLMKSLPFFALRK
jgi:hypothetical protein